MTAPPFHSLAAEPIWLYVDLPAWFVYGTVFVFGTICGSFLNVCVCRLPQHPHGEFWPALRHLGSPPSSCPRCRTRILWHDNVPIFGWLMLRGRCRQCRMWISPQYPLIEFLNGVLFVLVYALEVPVGIRQPLTASCLYSDLGPQVFPGLGGLSPEWWVHLRFLYHVVMLEALLAASLIDLRLMIIPDTVTLPAMAFGVVGATVIGRLHLAPVWVQEPRLARDLRLMGPEWLQGLVAEGPQVPAWIGAHPHLHGLAVSLAGLAVGAGVVWIVRVVGRWGLGREAMGDGDVVLMGMVGAFVGWQPVLIAFFVAPAFVLVLYLVRVLLWIGALLAHARFRWWEPIPYGPYLSLGVLVTLLGWNRIGPWALQGMFGLGWLMFPFFGAGLVLFVALLLAMRWFKLWIGIPLDEPVPPGVWTAADQSQYLAGEQVDRWTGRWPQPDDWTGIASGRGTLHEERWRRRRP